jgi:ubiquinone/menaquinone biosynthesis C-methylase UbiE
MSGVTLQNREIWRDPAVVNRYSEQSLFRPEQVILDMLRDTLRKSRMLDIGVGGGRTSHHFARLAKEYVGIDYSPEMTKACKSGIRPGVDLMTSDARALPFRNGRFDFILFSYNGIDCLSHKDRLQAFREVARVGCKGGYFCFSTHNLDWLKSERGTLSQPILAGVRSLIPRPRTLVVTIRDRLLFRYFNRHLLSRTTGPYLIVRDGSERVNLYYYYIRPVDQMRQLAAAGFNDICVIDGHGTVIREEHKLENTDGGWLHYVCRVQ